jgi:diacylglycerol kinase family enzyme
VYDVVILTLDAGCGARVPVLTLRDELVSAGARVTAVDTAADEEIDAVLAGQARLVVAAAADGQVRAVLRRLVKRYAPAPRERPADLPPDRTVPDLPPIGILPMAPDGLAARLGLPDTPAGVAAAVLGDRIRRLDLLRTDAGSVTLDGALTGGADADGNAVAWHGRVEVDDTVLSDGSDVLLACVVANGTGYSTVDGLPLAPAASPVDGTLDVAVALPVVTRSLLGRRRVRIEVRRARGRAVSVSPREPVPIVDDGVAASLDRKRSWWVERGAWAVYCS